MDLVAALERSAALWPQPDFSDPAAEQAAKRLPADGQRIAAMAALARRMERSAARIRAILKELAREATKAEADELRAVIDGLETYERAIKSAFDRLTRNLARGRRRLRRDDPGALAEFADLVERIEAAWISVLETYRDTRWNVMAMLAKLDRGCEGPAFENARQLRRHLAGRRG